MDRRILVNGGIPIAELVLEEIDACPGLDRPEACLPKLEEIFADWQAGGAAASLPLLIAAVSPRLAVLRGQLARPVFSPGCTEVHRPRICLSKGQSVDQRMRLGMQCRLSPTADVPSHTSGAAMAMKRTSLTLSDTRVIE